MQALFRHPAIPAWAVLVVLTIFSLSLAFGVFAEGAEAERIMTCGVLLVAFFKVRLVIMHFMEVGNAPVALRAVMEAWVILVCALLTGMYWLLPVG